MNIDQKNLYSRVIRSLGFQTVNKISKLKILICGMRGLGIEVAKNIILSGPNEVTLYDKNKVLLQDLGSNFYLKKEDIGKRRDISCFKRIKKLNNFVKINVLGMNENSEDLDKMFIESILNFDVIVITEILPKNELFKINEICRNNKKGFIYGILTGLSGFIFSDFGKEHIVYDKNGRKCKTYYCKNIEKSSKGLVNVDTSLEDFSLFNGNFVIFKNIKGMEELNESEPKKIFDVTRNSFCIGDTSNYKDYVSGGIIKEVKIPQKFEYQSLQKRFFEPFEEKNTFNIINCEKEGRNGYLFIIFLALHDFYSKNNNKLPEINNIKDFEILNNLVKKYYNEFKNKNCDWFADVQEYDEVIVSYISFWSKCEIAPLCSFLGGILCHEIIKYTGIYYPINQWFFFDFFEFANILNKNDKNLNNDNLVNSRYYEQIAIFGNEIQKRLSKLNIFMPGAGAIGCEVVKNMSLMGISTARESKFTITDYDLIEISNLTRQFLFQSEHIGMEKSKIAKDSILEINNDFNCESYSIKIGYESEDIFGDEFFEKQDFLISAVDSNEARKYLDYKSIQFNKIFINSGTLGPVSKYDLIIPNLTCCYHDFPESPKKEFGLCTIRSFPSKIEHCIEWTKNYFITWICKGISNIRNILIDVEYFLKEISNFDGSNVELEEKYFIIEYFLDILINHKFEYYLEFVIFQFNELFNSSIKQIIINHPLDSLDERGNKFWNGTKLPPHVIDLSIDDDLIFTFIKSYMKILLNSFSFPYIEEDLNINSFEKVVKNYKDKKFIREKNYLNKDNKERLKEKIRAIYSKKNSLKIKEFEYEKGKFDDLSIKFIASCSNLRARNYNIEECNEEKILFIIENIQPSLVTSSAAISGLLCMQIFGLIQTSSIKYCLNGFLNLIDLNLLLSKPVKPVQIKDGNKDKFLNVDIKAIPNKFNIWDKIIINESKTCGEIILFFKEKYDVDINYISINDKEIYYKRRNRKKNINNEEKEKEILSSKIENLFCEKNNRDIDKVKSLLIHISGKYKNLIAKIPLILYIIKN